jgi:hypothetical protein
MATRLIKVNAVYESGVCRAPASVIGDELAERPANAADGAAQGGAGYFLWTSSVRW